MRTEWDIERLLCGVHLVPAPPQHHMPASDLYAACLPCHQLPAHVRAFVDLVVLSFPQQVVPSNRRVARA